MAMFYWAWVGLVVTWQIWIDKLLLSHPKGFTRYSSKARSNPPVRYNVFIKNRKKPEWVVHKVLYLFAISGAGCGTVAALFNQLHEQKGESVSKTFVYNKVKENKHRIHIIKRNIKNTPPYEVPVNKIWGMDLTTVTYHQKKRYSALSTTVHD